MKKSKIVIMLAADGSPRMARTLLPFVDWEDPANLRVTVNDGGTGGINGHDLYMSDDLNEVCRVLKRYVQEGKSIYVPTNQKRFAKNLEIFCKGHLGLANDEVMVYHGDSPDDLRKDIIRHPERRL